MISMKDLRSISLDFRRLSSNLLTTSYEQANVSLIRFFNYINETDWIHCLLEPILSGTDYDFQKCFMSPDSAGNFVIPIDEKEHIKAQYDFMRYIIEAKNVRILGLAMKHSRSEETYNDTVQVFFSDAFKPLIDFINDSISKEMILVGGDSNQVPMFNINNNYGTAINQTNGTINSENTVNIASDDIKHLIEKIIPSIAKMDDVPDEEKSNVLDDMESIQEQLESARPKKNRMQKALNGIKTFVTSFPRSLAVNLATTVIVNADWSTLIQQLEAFIANIG